MNKQVPHTELARIQNEINHLFGNLLRLGQEGELGAGWLPAVDVCEGPEEVWLYAELPGIAPGDLEIQVHGDQVVLVGDKRSREQANTVGFQTAEREFGAFRRVVHLTCSVNPRQASARLAHGVLTVSLPKVVNRRGEPVTVTVTAEEEEHADSLS